MKSCENTNTGRPSIWPWPVTNPSPDGASHSIPKSWRVWVTEFVELFEGSLVEQKVDSFACGELARLVLFGPTLFPAPASRLRRSSSARFVESWKQG
ncbi:MAG: hypothetical protein R2748_05470 [Bryobacterales bacterium]